MKDLKNLIRVLINEMSWAGVLPAAELPPSRNLGPEASTTTTALNKFHGSKSFEQKATAAFAAMPYPVWILPVLRNSGPGRLLNQKFRAESYTSRKGIEALKAAGVTGVDFKDLHEKMKSGATIIVSLVAGFDKNFWPTPWMVIHAMFDNTPDEWPAQLLDVHEELEEIVMEGHWESETSVVELIEDCMTMTSATSGTLQGSGDIIPELLTQEIATKGGVRFNVTEEAIAAYAARTGREMSNELVDEVNIMFSKIVSIIKKKRLKERFIGALGNKRGKLVVIDTVQYVLGADRG